MEQELLRRINATNIGPQGFGGKTTALAVNIEAAPTHIAGLPAAVNIGCHVTRHAEKDNLIKDMSGALKWAPLFYNHRLFKINKNLKNVFILL